MKWKLTWQNQQLMWKFLLHFLSSHTLFCPKCLLPLLSMEFYSPLSTQFCRNSHFRNDMFFYISSLFRFTIGSTLIVTSFQILQHQLPIQNINDIYLNEYFKNIYERWIAACWHFFERRGIFFKDKAQRYFCNFALKKHTKMWGTMSTS